VARSVLLPFLGTLENRSFAAEESTEKAKVYFKSKIINPETI